MVLSDIKVLGTVLGNVYEMTLGIDAGTELGSLYGSFYGSNDDSIEGCSFCGLHGISHHWCSRYPQGPCDICHY